MPMSVQEQSSTFSSTTKKSVQVMQSSESFDQQQQQNVQQSAITGGGHDFDLSSSTSASSLASDSTLRDMQMMGGHVFRPTFDSMKSIMGTDFEDVTRDVCQINDGQTFEMKLDVQGYAPNEVVVKVVDNMVSVSAKQEQKSESNFSSRQFSKKFSIPAGVKAENLICNLTTEGLLKISAPIEKSHQQSLAESVVKAAQHKQVSKTQTQESTTSSRKSSLNSDISSVRDFGDEFILRPRRIDLSSLMSNTMQSENLSREVSNTNDGKKFEMKLEVNNFKPEEVQVKITKTLIKIEGKHESEFASRSFNKEFTIPHGVKSDTIQCTMNDDGILTISAPIQQQLQQSSSLNSSVSQQKSEQVTSSNVSSNVQQQQQQHKKLQETGRMDSTGSVSSTTSSVRESTSKRLDDMILRPIMNFDLDSIRDSMFEDVSKQICHVNEGKKFEVKIEVVDFKPEEIKVKIANNMVVIEAKQETANSSRSFQKKFSLPNGVKPENITSSLSPSGVLTISAPIEVTNVNRTTEQQITQQQQTQQSTQSVKQEQQRQQQQQQHSDSTSSIRSDLSSISNKLDRDFILRPIMNIDFDSLMGNRESMFEDVSKQISHVNEGKKFEVKLEVTDYKPEELTVKIANNMVVIEAKQDTATSSRSFFKKFSLPQGVKPENISSSLSPSGILTISAPIEVTSSTNRSEQQITQQQQTSQTSQSVKKEQQHQQQQHSDSNTSISSNLSSISSKLDHDFILRPTMDFDALMAKDTKFEDISKEICQLSDGKKFETKLQVPDFKPEELKISISNNMVTISGKQEMRQENNFSSKSFFKKFSIPVGVTPENITSSLSPQGVLTISAPITETTRQIGGGGNNNNTSSSHTTVTSSTSVTRSEQSNVSGGGNQTRPQIILKPKLSTNNMISSMHSSFEDISKDLYHVCDGTTFEMKLQVEDYKPEEIEVKISENIVTIEGKQEMRQENNFKSRQFCKKFTIPSGVKPETITCSLNGDVLLVSAPIDQSYLSSQNQQQLVESQKQQQTIQQQQQSTKKVSQTFSSTSSSTTSSSQQQQVTSSSTEQQQQQLK